MTTDDIKSLLRFCRTVDVERVRVVVADGSVSEIEVAFGGADTHSDAALEMQELALRSSE